VPTAEHVQQVLLKPVSLVAVVLGALAVGWLGNRFIRHWIGSAVRRAASRADSPRAERRAVTLTTMVANIWSMVRDLLAGFLLTVEGQFDIGDTIDVSDTTGVVEDLTLRVTRLRAPDGAVWFVPNGEIRRLGNTARGWGRATVDVPVPPTTDVDRLLDALDGAAHAVHDDARFADACLDAPVLWGVVATAVDSITGRVTMRTRAEDRDRVERAVRQEAVRRLGPLPAAPPSA
jgi:small-conductance mechanosensitive channel